MLNKFLVLDAKFVQKPILKTYNNYDMLFWRGKAKVLSVIDHVG